jgi:CRP-like cAMP-binding protein
VSPDQLDRVLDHPLFCRLSRDRLTSHLRPLSVRRCTPGEPVAEPSPRCPALHLVLSGRLQMFDVTGSGHRIILDHVEPGGVDGLLPVAGQRGHFTEATTVSEVVSIPRPALDQLIADQPGLALNLLGMVGARLRRSDDHLAWMCMRNPSQRIAAQLLATSDQLATNAAVAWTPRVSHEVLADLLGLRRETVTLHLVRLRRLGALSVESRRFRLNVRLLEAVRDTDGDERELEFMR